MQEATCNQCGASVLFSAKFCRQCGKPLDSSELTTRTLEHPSSQSPSFDHPTRPANSGATSPTYLPVGMAPQPPAPIYGSAPPSGNKTILIVVLALVFAGLLGLAVVAFAVFSRGPRHPDPPPEPPRGISGGVPGQPRGGMPQPPQQPPSVPNAPAAPGTSTVRFPFEESLRYPGSTVLQSVSTEDGKVAHLQTSDPIDKVADWFRGQIHVTKEINAPGNVILSNDDIKIILNGGAGGTQIMMTDNTD